MGGQVDGLTGGQEGLKARAPFVVPVHLSARPPVHRSIEVPNQ